MRCPGGKKGAASEVEEEGREEASAEEGAENGKEEEVSDAEEEAKEDGSGGVGPPGLSAMGLLRRMCRLADDKTYGRQTQRLAALRWIAVTAPGLRAELRPLFLPLMLVPLYRICEGTAPSPEPVKVR